MIIVGVHSVQWCEDGLTLSVWYDLADGGTAMQQWRLGEPVSKPRVLDDAGIPPEWNRFQRDLWQRLNRGSRL